MSLYKVTTTFALIMDKPKLISKPLGILIKDDIIEVIKFYNNWVYFEYENQDAYTHSYNLAELTKENYLKDYENNEDDEFCGLTPSMISKDISFDDNKKE